MPLHLSTIFEIQKYQNKPKFNGVYSINNLHVVPLCATQIKDRA